MKIKLVIAGAFIALSAAALGARSNLYFPPQDLDFSVLLPAPPQSKSEQESRDQRIFRETRALVGTTRWNQAIADIDESTTSLLDKFSCAAGRDLVHVTLPRLRALLERSAAEGAEINNRAKQVFRRPRPFTMAEGPTCEDKSLLLQNYDYPSGHAARGWMWAFVLTELIPDQAQAILIRGKEFAQSRVICGAHSQSAVEASNISAALVFARLQGSRAFREDVERARAELKSAATPPYSCNATDGIGRLGHRLIMPQPDAD